MRAFVADLQGIAAVVELEGAQAPSLSPDPDDDPILQTAVFGQTQALCTRDRHFRTPEVLAYCQEHGIQVLSDIELLHILRAPESSPPAS
jgi:hypothetical protein